VASSPENARILLSPATMDPTLPKRLARALLQRFVDPRSRLIYSYAVEDRDRALPTADELARGIPAEAAWGTGMEDSAMNGGLAVAALTRLGEHEIAGELAGGLLDLSDRCAEAGCVPRSALPGSGQRPRNTSTDQLGLYTYGLWAFAKGEGDAAMRQRATAKLNDIARRLERDAWIWNNEDGTPASGGKLDGSEAEKRLRLAGTIAAAAQTAGDPHWRHFIDLLWTKRDGSLTASTSRFKIPSPLVSGWGFYVPEQLQAQLHVISRLYKPGRGPYPQCMEDLACSTFEAGFPHAGHAPDLSEESRRILGEDGQAKSARDWRRLRKDLLERKEDLSWRDDYRSHPPAEAGLKGALAFVLGWMGRRPGFCHERAFLRYPLTAFHIGLLAEGTQAADLARREAEALFETVDLTRVACADTLVEALAVSSLLPLV